MQIRRFTNKDLKLIESFKVLKEDRKFTRTPLHNIELAQEDSERHPIIVIQNNRCVAYFTLHEGSGVVPYSDNPKAMFFRSFSVDAKHRGQGIGKSIIEALPHFIEQEFPNVNEIVLTVNTDNHKAIRLYENAGYNYTGDASLEGRPVYIMSYTIK
ncbi:putative acetyltransferase [Staphylococcus petrasii]|uniref:Putative acetyltransferase n=1 Tax=Staphylococcus petrasii TaxID=1276936 RepID=A0A380G4H2_9STAP|nr:GNAT family N-acetyltransferase [Staphylococcus petrasii]PNZ30605.1 GNAT family N-acetyltransferase [Staphylococcus petrasii]TGE12385.1 GNAT family N-acetyltransferase [Staphylococcus petrasii]SUM45168.1 putative acetyltransferase [Staphylococcus petrasii]